MNRKISGIRIGNQNKKHREIRQKSTFESEWKIHQQKFTDSGGILWQSASLIFSYDRSWVEVGSSNLFSTIFAMFKLFFEVEWSSSFSRRIFREVKMLLLLRLEKFASLRWREFFWKIKKWSTIFSILRRSLWSVFSFLFEDQSEFFTFCHIIAETNFESVIFSVSATHCFKRAWNDQPFPVCYFVWKQIRTSVYSSSASVPS